jgi:hypothetical protein
MLSHAAGVEGDDLYPEGLLSWYVFSQALVWTGLLPHQRDVRPSNG